MLIRAILKTALALGAVAALATSAQAHHGWSDYDDKTTLNLTGIVVESKYENPHATLKLKSGGKTWFAWLAPVSRMAARGMNGDMVKVGATITLIGYPSTSKKDELRVERVIVNGKATELR